MARVDSFLNLVVDQRASDLHLSAGQVPTIRLDGDLVRLPFRSLSSHESRRMLMEILDDEQRTRLSNQQEVDLVYDLKGTARFRCCVYQNCHGLGGAFRVIPSEIPTLEELSFPPSVAKLTALTSGLVLVTGPTGSGKTTTLAAIVNEINQRYQWHIITIEDPVEFIHPSLRSVVTHRQVGLHTRSFSAALRSALREAPDVLIIGELRDLDTITHALSAAETGTLVFGTLHTNSASSTINRLIDVVPEGIRPQVLGVLSVMLRGVISQKLCKLARGDGRIALMELLLQNYAVSNMIRENKVHQIDAYLQSVSYAETGMQSLEQHIARCVDQGLIDTSEALKAARYPDTVKKLIANVTTEFE